MRCLSATLSVLSLFTVVSSGLGATLYVAPASPNPSAPYSSWLTAAQTIQDAVNAAADHDEVVVTNGVYDTGGVALFETLTNRVAVTKPIVLRSVNGPDFTLIKGQSDTAAIRCVSLSDGAILSGFTLTNGSAIRSSDPRAYGGGGVWCETPNTIVTNCLLIGNWAPGGGGASGGTLYNCSILTNEADEGAGAWHTYLHNCRIAGNRAVRGGGVFQSTLYECTLEFNQAIAEEAWGGGAYQSSLYNCILSNNYVWAFGAWAGGAYESILSNCVLIRNIAAYGAGASFSQLDHCTLLTNSADYAGGGAGGGILVNCLLQGNSAGGGAGADSAVLTNCVLTGNTAQSSGGAVSLSTLNNCTLIGNSAGSFGGAADSCTAYDCTIVSNSATGYPVFGSGIIPVGGAANCHLTNCIVMFNRAILPNATNYLGGSLAYSCSNPLPPGVGNIDADPIFVDPASGDYRLSPGSPCIDAGTNLADLVTPDLAGLPRILDGNAEGLAQVDMGAYEFNPYRFVGAHDVSGSVTYLLQGEPNHQVRLETSPDLLHWQSTNTVRLPASGQAEIKAPTNNQKLEYLRAVRAE